MKLSIFYFFILSMLLFLSNEVSAMEPEYFYVKGILTKTNYERHQGMFDIRVSLWSSEDKTESDTIETALWSETHAVKLSKDGKFEIKVGSLNSLPEPFDYGIFEYIQLEAKLATGNKGYKHLDPRTGDENIDRNPLLRYPYRPKRNSNIEQKIQVQNNQYTFDENGKLTMAIMPNEITTTLTSIKERLTNLENRVGTIENNNKTFNSVAALQEIETPDIGRMHYVVDEQNYRFYNGSTWKEIGGLSEDQAVNRTIFHHNEIITLHSYRRASPGVFYWDRTQKSYYVGMADGSLRPLFGDSDLPGFIHDNWVDFRFANLSNMVIEKSSAVALNQHNIFGLNMRSSQNNWSQGVAFPEYSFERDHERTFEFVFRTDSMAEGRIMFGIADANIDVDQLQENAFHISDVSLYMQGQNGSNKLYGKDQNNNGWSENFSPEKKWEKNTFYKVVMRSSGSGGLKNNWRIEQVKEEDWTMVEKVLYEGQSYNTANSSTLKPFILLGGNQSGGDSNDYHLTGFRVY